jgi:hypothetical protein
MAQNRSERQTLTSNSLPIQMEVLRQSSESSKPQDSGKEETKIPLFWRVFGGTVLSITALIVMTAYQSLSGNIADLGKQMDRLDVDMRKEMSRLAELQGDLVRKDECEVRFKGVWTTLNDIKEDRKGVIEVKQRCASLLDQQRDWVKQRGKVQSDLQEVREYRAAAQQRAELRDELVRLRERLASVEGRHMPAFQPVMHPVGE